MRGHPSIFGVTPCRCWGDASHFLGWRLAFLGVTPRKIWGNSSREASPHCYNLAHIYVSWSYVWKYTNVKVTFLSIKTISRCLPIFVLQILGSNLLTWAILKSLIYFDIGFQLNHLNGMFFSTYNSICKFYYVKFFALTIITICRALSLLVLKILAVYWDPRY